ncbi:MAG: hypothetical protein J6Q83_02145 [Clostridia bacterium]|jgi:hypothetical protein|nr:hypothetical protein [Clostridia bacterium]
MTEEVRNIVVNFAVCSVIGGVLEYLTPVAHRKTLRVAVVGVVLAVCISPVLKLDFNGFSIENAVSEEQIAYDALMHTANLVEKDVRQQIKNILINNNVNEYEIYVTTSVDKKKQAVFLEEVIVLVDKSFEGVLPRIADDIPEEYKSIVRTGVKND